MPYLPDGSQVEIVLNPRDAFTYERRPDSGKRSLGWAGAALGPTSRRESSRTRRKTETRTGWTAGLPKGGKTEAVRRACMSAMPSSRPSRGSDTSTC